MELQSEKSDMDEFQHQNMGYSNIQEISVNEDKPLCHQYVEFERKVLTYNLVCNDVSCTSDERSNSSQVGSVVCEFAVVQNNA